MSLTVGIVGLGNLGMAISVNLMARGHKVMGYRRSSMRNFIDAGGIPANSAREVAEGSDFVITSLPSADAVADVYTGPNGIVDADRSGLVTFELSTVPIGAKLAAREKLEAAGMVMVEGTISGNPVYFANRTAAVFIGGDRATFDRYAAPLGDMTDKVTWLGPFGAGRVAKFVALYLVCAHTLAAAEAFEFATRAGIDRKAMFDAIAGSNASSAMLESRGALMLERDYSSFSQDKESGEANRPGGGGDAPVRGMASRVRQIERLSEFAHHLGGAYPLLDAMSVAYAEAIEGGFGKFDISEVFEYLMADGGTPQDGEKILALLDELG
jgi:3-hydroxyisobutyrate dehydrogenase-like beta-hydroxyacid dehydrogenase